MQGMSSRCTPCSPATSAKEPTALRLVQKHIDVVLKAVCTRRPMQVWLKIITPPKFKASIFYTYLTIFVTCMHLFVCVYTYIYICLYTIYVYILSSIRVHMWIYIYMHVCTCLYMSIVYVYMCLYNVHITLDKNQVSGSLSTIASQTHAAPVP